MFIEDHIVNQVAEDLLPLFEIGDFHSGTPTRAIISAAHPSQCQFPCRWAAAHRGYREPDTCSRAESCPYARGPWPKERARDRADTNP